MTARGRSGWSGRLRLPAPGTNWAGHRASPRLGSTSPPRSRSSWLAAHDGRAVCYPVGLNRHERHILDSTIMPAPVGPIVTQEARDLALGTAQALGTVGVLTVEFFLTVEGRLLVNEIAPRPHNSGHLTIEAAYTSQFEQQVRALCGLPLGETDLVMPAAMVNLLGDLWSQAGNEPRWDVALRLDPGVSLHLYGKQTAAPGRKMGHLTVLDPDPQTALDRALAARHSLTVDR